MVETIASSVKWLKAKVVDKISATKTTRSGMFSDVPVENVIIEKAEIV